MCHLRPVFRRRSVSPLVDRISVIAESSYNFKLYCNLFFPFMFWTKRGLFSQVVDTFIFISVRNCWINTFFFLMTSQYFGIVPSGSNEEKAAWRATQGCYENFLCVFSNKLTWEPFPLLTWCLWHSPRRDFGKITPISTYVEKYVRRQTPLLIKLMRMSSKCITTAIEDGNLGCGNHTAASRSILTFCFCLAPKLSSR